MPSLSPSKKPVSEPESYDIAAQAELPEEIGRAKEIVFTLSSSPFEKLHSIFLIIEKGFIRELPEEIYHSLVVCQLVTHSEGGYRVNKSNTLTNPYGVSYTPIAYLAELFKPCLNDQDYRSILEFDISLSGNGFPIKIQEINKLYLVQFMEVLGIVEIENVSSVRKKCTFTEDIGKKFLNEIKNGRKPEAKGEIISEQSSVDEVVEVSQSDPEEVRKPFYKRIPGLVFSWVKKIIGQGINNGFTAFISIFVLVVLFIIFDTVILPLVRPEWKSHIRPYVEGAVQLYQRYASYN